MILNLINDLLDLAKMESHTFNLHSNYFNLFEIVAKAIESIKFQADQKKITIKHEFDLD